jgi:hypothetical protein
MPKQIVHLGPFVGGLNNAADTPDTIADNELFVCQDFDYNIDQMLVTRPPVAVEALPGGSLNNKYFNILGFYVDPATGDSYTIAEVNGDLYYRTNSTSYKDAGAWIQFKASFGTATAGIQYVDYFYISKGTAGGYKWKPSANSAVAGMPALNSLTVFKERVWGSSADTNTARLYFSNIATPDTWSVSDFIDIGAGDGQKLVCAFAGTNAIYLFKTNSTYVLTYDSAPTRGYVQNISTTVGTFDPKCVAAYETTIFVMHGPRVYSLTGYTFRRLNSKVVIDRDTSGTYPQTYALSTVADRIIATYKQNTYVYYPLTDTWTQWMLPATGKWWFVPNSIQKYGYRIFLTSVNATAPAAGSVIQMQDKVWDVSMPEDLIQDDPIFITKMYTFDDPEIFKRLHWWGVDAIVTEEDQLAYLRLVALPYTFSSYETWDLLAATQTWDSVGAGTWNDLLSEVGAVPMKVQVTSKDRKYIKADKSLRFPRIQFKVQFADYRHTAVSSIHRVIVSMSIKQSPVSRSEGTRV